MLGDLFPGIEILCEQGRGHNQRRAGVREALARGTVGRELFRRVERDSGQIANRVGVLGIVQPPQHDRARIPGAGQRLGVQIPLDPAAQLLPLFGRWLFGVLGGHFAIVEHLCHFEPNPGLPADISQACELLQVQFSFGTRRGVTIETVCRQQRVRLLGVFGAEFHEGIRGRLVRASRRDTRHYEHPGS